MPRILKKIKYIWVDWTEQLAHAGATKNNFDPIFYRTYFGDLSHLHGERALRRHYYRHGRVEGRPGTREELVESLASKYGPLPPEFRPTEYRTINPDLRHLAEDYELIAHYLQFGRDEGREYIHRDDALENEYRLLASKKAAVRHWPETLVEFAHLNNLHSVLWAKLLNLGDFNLINREQLPHPCQTKIEAICIFIEIGVDKTFALSSKYKFDPEFYATVTSCDTERASASELYKYWLNTGFGRGEAPNEAEFLNGIIGEEEFPSCFNEQLYRKNVRKYAFVPTGRGNALRHFVESGFLKELEAIEGGISGASFMTALARRYLLKNQLAPALRAADKAVSMGEGVSSAHHTRGDVLKAQGNIAEATGEFLIAAHLPNASIWSHVHAIEGLAFTLEDFDQTLSEIEFSAARCSRSYHWRHVARRALTHAQNVKRNRYIKMYIDGRRSEADTELNADLKRYATIIPKIESLPVALPPSSRGPIVLIANRDLAQCDHYRVVQKYNYLRLGGWDVEIYDQNHSDAYRPALDRARAAIFYRTPATPDVIHAMVYARALGVQTFYDIDDLIFDAEVYPDTFDSFQGQISQETYAGLQYGVPLFRFAMQLCDIGISSTPELAKFVRPLVRSGTCHVLRNGLDYRNDTFVKQQPRRLSTESVTIFYGSGTKAHNQDFNELAAPALAYILRRHAAARMLIVGHLKLAAKLQEFGERIVQIPFSSNVYDYWETLSGADINLAPLTRSRTTDCKSEIKWLEAAMCGIPSIVSSTATYDETLRDGEDVLIARSTHDWTKALEYLVLHPERRVEIGNKAKEKALAIYSASAAVEELSKFLPPPIHLVSGEEASNYLHHDSGMPSQQNAATKLLDYLDGVQSTNRTAYSPAKEKYAASELRSPRLRLLVVNVYFPPHSIGGATRVVRDNVEYIAEHHGHMFDLAVVSSDVGSDRPYGMRIDSHKGVPVYRIAVDYKRHMDWHDFDDKMTSPFCEVLDRFKPDVIHFHCVQGLTATPVEVAARLNIPYIITTHDAWWISDFQFLIDEDGQLQVPSSDQLASSSSFPLGRLASLARRRRLERLLSQATKVLSVSNSFASIYKNAGVLQTIAVPNGISRLHFLPRTPSETGRVRLGHIGNRSPHKGATLLETVLRSNEFRNLSLVMVDNKYDAGYSSRETWGTTPIEIIGPVPQEAVTGLYARLDVLLAPSLWPESFGLVAREAKAAGLWVIASSSGAVGEEIEEDADGYVVDVSDATQLRDTLYRIDEDPGRYLGAPHADGVEPRRADDQGEDLVRIYREIAKT